MNEELSKAVATAAMWLLFGVALGMMLAEREQRRIKRDTDLFSIKIQLSALSAALAAKEAAE